MLNMMLRNLPLMSLMERNLNWIMVQDLLKDTGVKMLSHGLEKPLKESLLEKLLL